MKRRESLEQLLLERRIANCQRKLLHCESGERNLLLAILQEAEVELAEFDDPSKLISDPDPTPADTPRFWFHNA